MNDYMVNAAVNNNQLDDVFGSFNVSNEEESSSDSDSESESSSDND